MKQVYLLLFAFVFLLLTGCNKPAPQLDSATPGVMAASAMNSSPKPGATEIAGTPKPGVTVALAMPSPTRTRTQSNVDDPAKDLAELVAASLKRPSTPRPGGISSGIEGVEVVALEDSKVGKGLWLAYTYGMRSFDPLEEHFVAIYAKEGSGWRKVSSLSFDGPDYIDQSGVRQVEVDSNRTWIEVVGGMGAHGGYFDLVSFDGKILQSEVASGFSSPGAGFLEDLDGDGALEVILSAGENYVFCYACSVRLILFDVLRWNGSSFSLVELERLSGAAPAEVRRLNNKAVDLARAGLWKDALYEIYEALDQETLDETVYWNAAIIRLHADARAEQAFEEIYPILDYMFFGDYDEAIAPFRELSAEQIFSKDTPLVKGTVAQGWEDSLTTWITGTTQLALEVKPDLAPAYFLRGWANYISNPGNPKALADIQKAAQLDPKDKLYSDSVAYLKK